ncbi:MAG: winged helix-turn-helix transcriptional regulator [Leptolyngbya sp. SIO4C1]|nr:winged helix-turn-helix transcriptional regulator [Leptolyngbya sp. SIO4C1]
MTPKQIAQQMTQSCIARRLRQINRQVTRLYDDALRSHGVTINQLNVLAVIVSQGQIQPGQLGRLLGMEKSTVSRTVERMVKRGWLEVGPGKDGRTQRLQATPAGRQLIAQTAQTWDTLQATVLASLTQTGLTDSAASGVLELPGLIGLDPPPDEEAAFYDSDRFAEDFYA